MERGHLHQNVMDQTKMNFYTPIEVVNIQNSHTHRAQIRHIKHPLTTNEKGSDPILTWLYICIRIEKATQFIV